MQQHLTQSEAIKNSLMSDLQSRCERIIELEIALDQVRDQYNLAIRNNNNKSQQKKIALLQRNLEQLTQVQRQIIEQNSTLKKEVVISQKLLVSRNDRITELEESLRKCQLVAAQERENFADNLTGLRDRLAEVKSRSNRITSDSSVRIVKPLRGGGGSSSTSSESKPSGLWDRFNSLYNSPSA
jgi:kinesin family protein 5